MTDQSQTDVIAVQQPTLDANTPYIKVGTKLLHPYMNNRFINTKAISPDCQEL